MAGLPLEPLHNNGDHRFLYAPAGGGGGGKVGRRRVSKTRNAATPYERPSVGRHASAGPVQAAAVVANGVGGGEEAEEAPARRRGGGGGGTWLGVDLLGTASKLVTSGASLFYSSFFGRRQQQQQQQQEDATAPLSVTNNGDKNTAEENHDGHPGVPPMAVEAELVDGVNDHGEEERAHEHSGIKISEIEGWMKSTTFPREEADRLIGILRSSVVDNGVDVKKAAAAAATTHEVKPCTPNTLHRTRSPANGAQQSNGVLSDAQRWREELTKNRQEQKFKFWPVGFDSENHASPAAGGSEDAEVLDSSPVDLARAYMDERVTPVAGPTSQLTGAREKPVTPLQLLPYQPMPLSSRHLRKGFQHENSRSPYRGLIASRSFQQPPFVRPPPHPIRGIQEIVSEDKPPSPPVPWTVTPPGSALGLALTELQGSKKRAATALDDGGYSSGGPMRRLRPRSFLYTPSPVRVVPKRPGLGQFSTPTTRAVQTTPMEVKQNPNTVSSLGRALSEAKKSGPGTEAEKDEELKGSAVALRSLPVIPVQSSETARKILETLERMTPTPRGKLLDEELALAREQPASEPTSSLIKNDQAHLTQTQEIPEFHKVRDAGPAARNLENDLPCVEGFAWKESTHSTKLTGKGKAPVFGFPEVSYEKKITGQTLDGSRTITGSAKETLASCKEPEETVPGVGPIVTNSKGFRISAAFQESGSDDESQAAYTGLHVSTISTTSTSSIVKPVSQVVFSDIITPKSMSTIIPPVMGAPASVETNPYVTSWNPISSRAGSPGGFTFPSSTQSGASFEAPSTPKAFPTAAANNGGPAFKFSSDPIAGKLVFSLPSGVVESAEDSDPFNRKNFKFDSKPDLVFSPAVATTASTPRSLAIQESPVDSVESTEVTAKSNNLPTIGQLAPDSLFPHASLATTSPNFLTTSFSSASTRSEPGKSTSTSFGTSAGYNPTSEQHAISNPSSKFALDMNSSVTPSSNIHVFGFGSTKSASVPPAPATVPQAGTSYNISGTSSLAATAATLSPFTFGSSFVSQPKKSPFQFGAPSVPSSQITSPSTHSPQADESQKKMFDQEIKNTSISSNISGALSAGVAFGFTTMSPISSTSTFLGAGGLISGSSSAASSNSTPSQALFATPSIGQGISSSASVSTVGFAAPAPLPFGLAVPTTALSNPATSTTIVPSPLASGSTPNHFEAFSGPVSVFGTTTSSAFGSSNLTTLPTSTGASSAPAIAVQGTNNQVFGGFSDDVAAQPSPVPSLFGSGFGASANLGPSPPSSTFSFGAPSTSSTTSTFVFGSLGAAPSSGFSFGVASGSSAANPFSFGAKPESSSTPVFGSANFGSPFGSSPNWAVASDANAENHMEDSMAEEPPLQMASGVASSQQLSLPFSAPQPAGSAHFVFPQQSTPAGPAFSFGGQPSPPVGNAFAPTGLTANPFTTPAQQHNGSGLNFDGGSFALGSSGQETSAKTNRKFIKAKRIGTTKRK